MSKRIPIAVAVALAGVALAWWLRSDRDVNAALTLYGNVDIREVDLAFRVPGRLTQMAFEEGDRVEEGALLARLDDEPYRQEAASAAARVDLASAKLSLFISGSRPQEIQRAEAGVREARAALVNAEGELGRQRGLAEQDATSERRLDDAVARHEEASARLGAAQEALDLAREGFRAEEIAAAEAEVALARADAERANTLRSDTELRAPAGGTLLSRIREPGAILRAGDAVYTLSLDRSVWIRAYVDEPDLGRVAPGMRVWIESDSTEGRFEGQVGFISPRAEFTPKSVETESLRTALVYRLRIVVLEPDGSLRQGMPVTITVPEPDGEGA